MMKNKLLLAAVMVCCFVAGFAQAPREITERFDVYKAQVIRRVAYVDMVQLKFVPLAPKANKKLLLTLKSRTVTLSTILDSFTILNRAGIKRLDSSYDDLQQSTQQVISELSASPQLRDNEDFIAITDEMEGNLNRIITARGLYNEQCKQLGREDLILYVAPVQSAERIIFK